jgi:hypothetical protein
MILNFPTFGQGYFKRMTSSMRRSYFLASVVQKVGIPCLAQGRFMDPHHCAVPLLAATGRLSMSVGDLGP